MFGVGAAEELDEDGPSEVPSSEGPGYEVSASSVVVLSVVCSSVSSAGGV